jgi:hypothetical protein
MLRLLVVAGLVTTLPGVLHAAERFQLVTGTSGVIDKGKPNLFLLDTRNGRTWVLDCLAGTGQPGGAPATPANGPPSDPPRCEVQWVGLPFGTSAPGKAPRPAP